MSHCQQHQNFCPSPCNPATTTMTLMEGRGGSHASWLPSPPSFHQGSKEGLWTPKKNCSMGKLKSHMTLPIRENSSNGAAGRKQEGHAWCPYVLSLVPSTRPLLHKSFLLLKNPLGVTLQHPLGEPYLLPIGADLASG